MRFILLYFTEGDDTLSLITENMGSFSFPPLEILVLFFLLSFVKQRSILFINKSLYVYMKKCIYAAKSTVKLYIILWVK